MGVLGGFIRLLTISMLTYSAMTQYQLFLFLHIVSVILWLGAGTTLGLLWLHPDPALRERIGSLGEWLGPRVFAPGAFGALAFGLVLVHRGQLDLPPALGEARAQRVRRVVPHQRGRPGAARPPARARAARIGRVLSALALFELAVLYLTVADMALKPTGSDTAFLVPAASILALWQRTFCCDCDARQLVRLRGEHAAAAGAARPPDLRRADPRRPARVARPDDRGDRAADDRRRPRRALAPVVGRDRVPARVDDHRPALREVRRPLRPQGRRCRSRSSSSSSARRSAGSRRTCPS